MSPYSRTKVIAYTVVAGIAVAVIVWAWLAFTDPGTHIDWQLPDVPGSEIVADTEVQSNVDDSWARYLVVLADPPTTAKDLTREMRASLDKAGWETRPGRRPPGSVHAESGSKDVAFGPASTRRRYVPRSVVELMETTEGPVRRKVLVGMYEYP